MRFASTLAVISHLMVHLLLMLPRFCSPAGTHLQAVTSNSQGRACYEASLVLNAPAGLHVPAQIATGNGDWAEWWLDICS